MTDLTDPGEARLRRLFRSAAWSRDEICINPAHIGKAQEIVDDTGKPVKLAVFDGEHIVDSKQVFPSAPTPKL